MRYFIILLIFFPLLGSCQESEVSLYGTWHYERRSRPEHGFTMRIDGEDVIEKSNNESEDGNGMDHFYLVFDDQEPPLALVCNECRTE